MIKIFLVPIVFAANSAFANTFPTKLLAPDVLTNREHKITLQSDDKGMVVVFMSAKCPCSASHEKGLKKLFQEYSQAGFRFVGVHSNTDENTEMTKSHFVSAELPFTVLQDEKAKIADQFGAVKTPHVYVINNKGEALYQGGIDNANNADKADKFYLKEALAALKDGKAPKEKITRTLGCAIQRP